MVVVLCCVLLCLGLVGCASVWLGSVWLFGVLCLVLLCSFGVVLFCYVWCVGLLCLESLCCFVVGLGFCSDVCVPMKGSRPASCMFQACPLQEATRGISCSKKLSP